MKMTAIFLAVVTVLSGDPIPLDNSLEPIGKITSKQEERKKFFNYFGIGGCGLGLPLIPEATIGCRKLNAHHVWDVNGGGSPFGFLYGQVSYLYFPQPSSGLYFGVGITGGIR